MNRLWLPRAPSRRLSGSLACAVLIGALLLGASVHPDGRAMSAVQAKKAVKAPKTSKAPDVQDAAPAPVAPSPAQDTTSRALAAAKKSKSSSSGSSEGNGTKGKRRSADPDPPTTTPTPTTTTPPTARPSVATPAAATIPVSAPSGSGRRTGPRRTEAPRTGARRSARPTAALPARGRAAAGAARETFGGRLGPAGVLGAVPAASITAENPERSRKASEEKSDDSGSVRTVTRTVRDIVEVVPGPIKMALGALAVLSALLAAGYVGTAMRARSLARQRAELLQDVGLLQTALLPPVPATVGALRTSVAYRPSEGFGAGGDFYDALTLPEGKSAFILGDVCGHGRQALARTAFMRYTLRAYLEAGLEPAQALQVAGPVIDEHLGGNFATVVLAVHDPKTGSLTYACAGHPAPIVVGPTRPEPVLAASSPPMGLSLRTGVRQTIVPLPPGSIVCLYTDGLAEARTTRGILGRPRLMDIVEELGRDATAKAVIERVSTEARLVTDDMATVVLSPTAGVTAGGFRMERLEVNEAEVAAGLADQFLEACGIDEPGRTAAVHEARSWCGSHVAAVLRVRFGTRGPMVEVSPPDVDRLGAAMRSRALV